MMRKLFLALLALPLLALSERQLAQRTNRRLAAGWIQETIGRDRWSTDGAIGRDRPSTAGETGPVFTDGAAAVSTVIGTARSALMRAMLLRSSERAIAAPTKIICGAV